MMALKYRFKEIRSLQENVSWLNITVKSAGPRVNVDKTEAIVFVKKAIDMKIKVRDEAIDNV